MTPRLGDRRVLLTLIAAVLAIVVGMIVIGVAVIRPGPPQPGPAAVGVVGTVADGAPAPSSPVHRTGSSTLSTPSPSALTPTPTLTPEPLHLPASAPTQISIPAIGVKSPVFAIGKTADGGLQVPQPGPQDNQVAWYEDSPTPGQAGPSVLAGHIDTIRGPSIFYRLGAVKPGNAVSITRADGSTAVFTVNAVRSYPDRKDFPTDLVYAGGGDLTHSTLSLITCTNFDRATSQYLGNVVVFAHLTSVKKA